MSLQPRYTSRYTVGVVRCQVQTSTSQARPYNLDTPVDTLWALFVARCKQVLGRHVPTKLFMTLQPTLGQEKNLKFFTKEKEVLQEGTTY